MVRDLTLDGEDTLDEYCRQSMIHRVNFNQDLFVAVREPLSTPPERLDPATEGTGQG